LSAKIRHFANKSLPKIHQQKFTIRMLIYFLTLSPVARAPAAKTSLHLRCQQLRFQLHWTEAKNGAKEGRLPTCMLARKDLSRSPHRGQSMRCHFLCPLCISACGYHQSLGLCLACSCRICFPSVCATADITCASFSWLSCCG